MSRNLIWRFIFPDSRNQSVPSPFPMTIIAIDTVFHAIFVREDDILFRSTMHDKYLTMMQKQRFIRVMYHVFLKREHVIEDIVLLH